MNNKYYSELRNNKVTWFCKECDYSVSFKDHRENMRDIQGHYAKKHQQYTGKMAKALGLC